MEQPRMAKDLSEYQDVWRLLMKMRLYTPISVCFPLQETSSQSEIIETLTKGLERLSASFPWLAGQVVEEGGLAKIIPLDKTCRLIVKDLIADAAVPSMEALRNANFPFSMLDGEVLTPLTGPPTTRVGDVAPVFFLQANFINGGLLLIFAGEHSQMDGHALGQVMRIFSKACHDESFTDEELLQGNRARTNIVPLLDQTTYKPGPELDFLVAKPGISPPPGTNTIPPKSSWAYCHFTSAGLSKLKALAAPSSSGDEKSMVTYITTNDAVSAFIWQAASRARSFRLPPQTKSTFGRAVDVRSSLSIPPTYLGNMSNHTYNTIPLSSICSSSLGNLASSLRSVLRPSDLSYGMRSLATQVTIAPETVSYGSNMDFSSDIFFSSWARLQCYEFDFSLGLGFPESVRRPRHSVVEGLMYLMPMDRSGGVDAAICLRDDELAGLKGDREFREYAEWIG